MSSALRTGPAPCAAPAPCAGAAGCSRAPPLIFTWTRDTPGSWLTRREAMLWIVALACGDCAVNASVNETSASVIRTSRRSEEHTSELQSLAYLVCRLLLEKK